MRNDRGNVECRFVAGNLWWQVAWCGVSEIAIHSLRSNWPGTRREGGSVSAAILDRLSNEAPGQFQRNPKGGMSFGRRRCCSLLTDPLRERKTTVPGLRIKASALRGKTDSRRKE